MKLKISVILVTCFIVGKVFSQLPACKDSFPSSLLLNNSFEQYSGCISDFGGTLEGGFIDADAYHGGIQVPYWHSFARNSWEVHYFNYNCRSGKVGSVFDTTVFLTNQLCSYYYPRVPLPLPDDNGFIGIEENDQFGSNENRIAKNYITYCLSLPLYKGQAYLLSFYFGFGTKGIGKCPQGTDRRSQSLYRVAIFGRQDCPGYPLNDPDLSAGCLTNNTGWVKFGSVLLKGENEWITAAIPFTPQIPVSCIGIGPDCDNNSYSSDFNGTSSMHYMDKFVLSPIADFSFRTITALSGDVCNGHYLLKAPSHNNATYQWYKDGELIPGAISETYQVPDKPEAAGNYVVNIGQPYNTCFNSLPFAVTFSNLNSFALGKDTTLCEPASIILNAAQYGNTKYEWQDGSNNETFTVIKSGSYWVKIQDENGCIKKDSIEIIIQGCEECKLFVPSAFTPNGDGLNDIFRAKPQCQNIGLSNYSLRIYNRWGVLIFRSNDINKGWDGTYHGRKLDAGSFVYFINYSYKKSLPMQQKGTIALIR